jgi:hypothetical protein
MADEISARCEAIEACYEFMLAYAGQGLAGDEPGQSTSQVREHLRRAVDALTGLADAYSASVQREKLEPPAPYLAFLKVLARDANDSLAAIELVLAQPILSSQLVDNLNASIHLRALLTDLFLIDEIVKPQRIQAKTVIID